MPASPPLIPTMTLSPTASGAAVMACPVGLSPTWTAHRWAPDANVQRHEVAIERPDIDRIAENRYTAVHAWEAKVQHPRRNRTAPLPYWPAALRSSATTLAGPDVTYMTPSATTGVAFQRSGTWRLIHPERPEQADRFRRDLGERRKAVCAIRPAVHQPMTVTGRVARQPRRRDLRENDWRKNHTAHNPQEGYEGPGAPAPFLVSIVAVAGELVFSHDGPLRLAR